MRPEEYLDAAKELRQRKNKDYNNGGVLQAEHYLRGVDTIYDIMHGKMLRMISLMNTMKETGDMANFESIQDSCLDLINYTSFLAAYMDGDMNGQHTDRDVFNNPPGAPGFIEAVKPNDNHKAPTGRDKWSPDE